MAGFTKLFDSILDSSIWQESKETKIVWITMLAMADRSGVIEAAIPGLANRAGVTIQEAETAVETFLSPDPYSRTTDYEGRRIEKVDGGWRLLNHEKFRQKLSAAERKEYQREWMRKKRAEKSTNVDSSSTDVDTVDTTLTNIDSVDTVQKQSTEAEYRSSEESTFDQFWEIYPRKVGKGAARKAFAKACKRAEAQCIIDALKAQVGSPHAFTEPKYSPHASTWLNRDGWEDELEAAQSKNTEF